MKYPIQMMGLLVLVSCAGCGSETNSPESAAEPVVAVPKPAPRQIPLDEFMVAALEGRVGIIKEAIAGKTDVNTAGQEARTALMLAAFNGHAEVVRLLVDAGATVAVKDATGRTALMYAATGMDVETVRILLKNGAKVNEADAGEQFTALMWAAAEGRTAICELLLAAGADATMKDVDGDDAATFAAQKGHVELAAKIKAAEK